MKREEIFPVTNFK